MNRRLTLLKPSFWAVPETLKYFNAQRDDLSRCVDNLTGDVSRLLEKIQRKDSVIQDEVDFLELFLTGPAEVSYEALKRRVSRLRGVLGS